MSFLSFFKIKAAKRLPLWIRNSLRRLFFGKHSQTINSGNLSWFGDFETWDDARLACSGYNPELYKGRLLDATAKVETGEAAFERDTVLFEKIVYSWPLLAHLLWIYQREKSLKLIDFGGSLGTTWRQNRKYLVGLPEIEWNVVEQEEICQIGKAKFEREPLRFFSSVFDPQLKLSQVFLASCVLCYLPNPFALFDQVDELLGIKYLLVDRTPFSSAQGDRLTIQNVPSYIYPASYPCWLFSQKKVLTRFSEKWNLIESWDWDEQPWNEAVFRGLLFERKNT